jgi:tRNA threonylcarbamoyladenosine biosynthesis protein TsaB
MCRILLIETSSKNCSVGLSVDGQLVHHQEMSADGYIHAEKLHSFIQEVLQDSGVTTQQLNAVAVSKGPGSYTGLRIGVSAAKGLCFALNIPLIALDTTWMLAWYAKEQHPQATHFLSMIDARRMEVYYALYDASLSMADGIKAQIVDDEFLSRFNMTATVLVGDGAEKCKSLITGDFIMLPALPSVTMMAAGATDFYRNGKFEDTAYFEPFYLKDFIAGKPKKSMLE